MNGCGRRGLGGLVAVWLAACTAEPPSTVPSSPAVPTRPAGWCTLVIGFEPPLPTPVDLHWRHEAGAHGCVRTACTAVRLLLPPGPLVLTLGAAPGDSTWVLRVDGDAAVVWPADRRPGVEGPRTPSGPVGDG